MAEQAPRQGYIATRNLDKSFVVGDQLLHVLKRINVDIQQGRMTIIMGPSGSGKSTLLYQLGGLDRPDNGEVEIAGQRLNEMTNDELARFRRETLGFIFQQYHLIPTLTALENVALPGLFAGMSRPEREGRAARLLEFLRMGDRLDYRPAQLSGGQQQRVAIARALFNNPPILMADEPTGSLDSKTGQIVIDLLRMLVEKRGKTVLIVTHDQGVAAYGDRILYIKDGRIDGDMLPATATPDALTEGSNVSRTESQAASAVDRVSVPDPGPDVGGERDRV